VVLVPIGRIADIRGRKRVFLIGITIYILGCIAMPFSAGGSMLIAMRVFQGIGGAMIFGTSVAILTSVFPPGETGKAIGINVTYCAFCEIPRLCGIVEACEPGCYSDEVVFPGHLEPLGIRFLRTKTLARGGDCCDFRWERIQ
jgi:hypothetical protein